MKKRILFFTVAAVVLMTGCDTQNSVGYKIDYVYVNQCSSQITITVHSDVQYDIIGMEDYSQLVIPVDGQCTISLIGEGGFSRPFYWVDHYKSEYIIISNGEKTVSQSRGDKLFMPENYITKSETKTWKTARFVLTDEFLENEEPVE